MTDQDKFNKAVMNWISEATGLMQYRSDGGRRILADFCGYCWSVFEAMNHDAVPEAIASPSESSVPRGNGGGCGGTDKPVTLPAMGTGNIPDSRTRLSEAEIDALEYVVEQGRLGSMDDYGILRSLLVRVRPEWEAADSVYE